VHFAKSGNVENPVTKSLEFVAAEFSEICGDRPLVFLGTESIPALGDESHLQDFAGPEHVVIELKELDLARFGVREPGLYLIQDLHPSKVSQ